MLYSPKSQTIFYPDSVLNYGPKDQTELDSSVHGLATEAAIDGVMPTQTFAMMLDREMIMMDMGCLIITLAIDDS